MEEPPSYESAIQIQSKSCSKCKVLCTCSVLGIVVFLCVAFLCFPSPVFNLHDQKDSPTPASPQLCPTPPDCPSCTCPKPSDSPWPESDFPEGPTTHNECPSCPTHPDCPTPLPCDPCSKPSDSLVGPTISQECPSCPTRLPDYPTPRPCDPCLPCEVCAAVATPDSITQDRISFLERCCVKRYNSYSECLVAPSPDSNNFIDWAGACCIHGSDCYIS